MGRGVTTNSSVDTQITISKQQQLLKCPNKLVRKKTGILQESTKRTIQDTSGGGVRVMDRTCGSKKPKRADREGTN